MITLHLRYRLVTRMIIRSGYLPPWVAGRLRSGARPPRDAPGGIAGSGPSTVLGPGESLIARHHQFRGSIVRRYFARTGWGGPPPSQSSATGAGGDSVADGAVAVETARGDPVADTLLVDDGAAGRVDGVAAWIVEGDADTVAVRGSSATGRDVGVDFDVSWPPATSSATAAASTPAAFLRLPILAHLTRPRINAQSGWSPPGLTACLPVKQHRDEQDPRCKRIGEHYE